MIPSPTVLHQVESLSEDLYNTISAQPPPSVPAQKTKAQLKQGTSSQESQPQPAKSSSGTELHEVPPAGDPLEEANIWVEILKLEPRKTNNRIAEGFANWLKANMIQHSMRLLNYPLFTNLVKIIKTVILI